MSLSKMDVAFLKASADVAVLRKEVEGLREANRRLDAEVRGLKESFGQLSEMVGRLEEPFRDQVSSGFVAGASPNWPVLPLVEPMTVVVPGQADAMKATTVQFPSE